MRFDVAEFFKGCAITCLVCQFVAMFVDASITFVFLFSSLALSAIALEIYIRWKRGEPK